MSRKASSRVLVLQHAPRAAGEQAAAPPVHRAISSSAYVSCSQQTSPIKTFQFLDDGPWVKVYVPLMDLYTISQENVEARFTQDSFSLLVRGLQKCPLELTIPKLYKAIVPEECSAKILRTKVWTSNQRLHANHFD
jgi:hypothetical protein